jgi:TetR/AcrR family acrAB operon transcriptional repressor
MARKTKEEAQATRSLLLDAAERLFHAKGVSRTSLQDIAAAAGATRGAIYWHFEDKADLINAMMERIRLPFEEALEVATRKTEGDALASLRQTMQHALQVTATDERVRRVVEVMMQKVEYVDELEAVRERRKTCRDELHALMRVGFWRAARQRGVKLGVPLDVAVLGLHVLVDGLIENWLLDPSVFDLRSCGAQVIDTYLAGLGFVRPADGIAAPAPPQGAMHDIPASERPAMNASDA